MKGKRGIPRLATAALALLVVEASWAQPENAPASRPFLYFKTSDLAAMRSAWGPAGDPVHREIYEVLKTSAARWLDEDPVDPGEDYAPYVQVSRKMVTLAFLYVLDPSLTSFRDKALEFTDMLVEVHQARVTGGWDMTLIPGQTTPNDVRDSGLAYSIQWFAAVLDWLYDWIPEVPTPETPYRSKAQYVAALNTERERMREAIESRYSIHWGNWWPNSWMQNHSTLNYSAFAIATWCLEPEISIDPADLDLAADAMKRIQHTWDALTPDGAWQEGYHYQTVGMMAWINGFHVQETAKGVDNWPREYLDAFADWMVANILDATSRSYLVKAGDAAANDPPVTTEVRHLGHEGVFLAHTGAAKTRDPGRRARFMWAADQFDSQGPRIGHLHRVLDYVLEYLLYTPGSSEAPTAKRYSFTDRHVYVWTQGHEASDYKVASIGGGYAGDAGIESIALLTNPPWRPFDPISFPSYPRLNTGHSHEDAGQYFFRLGHTELTTEYNCRRAGFMTYASYHNTLLIDPEYDNTQTAEPRETRNPIECGQFDPYLYDGGTGRSLVPTRTRTPHNRWLGAAPDQVFADYVVYDLAPRYQTPRNEKACGKPPSCDPAPILNRYDRRILWIRDAVGFGPILFVHDEVEADEAHTYEWRHHSVVPEGRGIRPSTLPAQLPFWRVDCPDGWSLAFAVGVPTSGQGAPFEVSSHQHDPVLFVENPPHFLRVTNSVPVANTHMGFMMFPVRTSSWLGPRGYPPNVSYASVDRQNSPGVLAYRWKTNDYLYSMNFMDDGAEANGLLLVDGVRHVSAAFLAERVRDRTAAQVGLFWGFKAVDFNGGDRCFIQLSSPDKLADVMTQTGAGRLDIYVTAHNQKDLETLLDQALFYEHPTSQNFIGTVSVNGVEMDTPNPGELGWTHKWIGGKSHIRMARTASGNGSKATSKAQASHSTALGKPSVQHPGGSIRLRYTVGSDRTKVRIGIYDVRGRLVRMLYDGLRDTGDHTITWNRNDRSNVRVPRGVYFVRLVAGAFEAAEKLTLAP